jgi:hypothetical protein
MPTSLTEASKNAQTDLDVQVIDEFRKESAILDALTFDDAVNPAGGGATLTYGYRRLVTQPTAATRAINSEYTPSEVTTEHYTTTLAVMGGSFEIDRVLARVGPAASGAVALNLRQKVKATVTKFQDEVINGDTAVDANGFDGLDKALTGSDTEYNATGVVDWSDLDTNAATKHTALDAIDTWLSLLDGEPTVVFGNQLALAKMRAIVRRSSMYVREPVEGLVGANGRPITRESYGGVVFADAGNKAGTNDPIIPVYDPDNSVWVVTNPDGADGGTFKLTVTNVSTGESDETAAIAWNANAATVEAAVEALDTVGAGNGTTTGTGPWTITFSGDLAGSDMLVTVSNQSVTDGGVAEDVTVAETANTGGLTDLYAVRIALDGFHGVSTVGSPLVQTWLPDFAQPGAVKKGEVELGPVSVALKATKAAAVFRRIRVR